MNIRNITLAAFFALLWCLSRGAKADDLQSCLSKLESATNSPGQGELDACAAIIRRDTPRGDAPVSARLLAVARNGSAQTSVRAVALNLACEKASGDQAARILALTAEWLADLDTRQHPPEQLVKDPHAPAKSLLISAFVTKGARSLEQVLGDQTPLLRQLELICLHAWCGFETRTACYEAIASSPAPPEQRCLLAIGIIREGRRYETAPSALLKMLDSAAFPELRALVRSNPSLSDFNFTAAAALAHLGDREICDTLWSFRTKWAESQPNGGAIVEFYLWQIDTQHPPQRLLDAVGAEHRYGSPGRVWALQRAVELGLPNEDIRAAILKYAATVKPERRRTADGREYTLWGDLVSIKREGIRLGILKADDLPEVKLPTVEPTP